MRIAVVREQGIGERRVALTPEAAETLVADGHFVVVESGAGVAAGMGDEAYRSAGASVTSEPSTLLADGTVVVSVNGPGDDLLSGIGPSHVVVGLFDPVWRPEVAAGFATTGASMISLDLVPRSTRAQAVDVLSSMATVIGFQAVLLAAERLPKMLPQIGRAHV